MDNKPREYRWWLPWHWSGQQMRAVVLALIALVFGIFNARGTATLLPREQDDEREWP